MVNWKYVRDLQLEYLDNCAPGKGYTVDGKGKTYDPKTETPLQRMIFEDVVRETWDYAHFKSKCLLGGYLSFKNRFGGNLTLTLLPYKDILSEGDLIPLGYMGLRRGMQSFRHEGKIKGFFDSRYCFAARRGGIKLAASLIGGNVELKIKILERPTKDIYEMAEELSSGRKGANPVMQARALRLSLSGKYIDLYDDYEGTRPPLVNILSGEERESNDCLAMKVMQEELLNLDPNLREALMLNLLGQNLKAASLERGLTHGSISRRAKKGFTVLQQRVLERVGQEVALSK